MNKILWARYRALTVGGTFVTKLLKALTHFFSSRSAKLLSASVEGLNIDNEVDASTFVSLLDTKAQEFSVNSYATFAHKLLFQASKVAILIYHKALRFTHDVNLNVSTGATLNGDRKQFIGNLTNVIATRCRVLGTHFYNMHSAFRAKGESATGRVVKSKKNTLYCGRVSRAIAAGLVYASVGIAGIVKTFIKSKFVSAKGRVIDTEDGTLYSGYDANVDAAPSEIIKTSEESMFSGHSVTVGSSQSDYVSINNGFTFGHFIEVDAATAMVIQTEEGTMNTDSDAVIRLWSMPVLENGVLYIKQAYDVVQNGNVLEVM